MFQCKRFQIIKERIYQGTCVREGVHWNSHPGALFLQSSATAVTNFPFPGPGSRTLNNHPAIQSSTGPLIRNTHFTAVIFTTTTPQLSSGSSTGTGSSSYIHHNNPIFKLVASVAASQYVDKVFSIFSDSQLCILMNKCSLFELYNEHTIKVSDVLDNCSGTSAPIMVHRRCFFLCTSGSNVQARQSSGIAD